MSIKPSTLDKRTVKKTKHKAYTMQTSGSWHKVFCFPDMFVDVCSMINVDFISIFSAPEKDCIFWGWRYLSPHLFGGTACTNSSSSFSNQPYSLIITMYTFIALRREGERHLLSSTRIKHGIFQLDQLCWSRSLFGFTNWDSITKKGGAAYFDTENALTK